MGWTDACGNAINERARSDLLSVAAVKPLRGSPPTLAEMDHARIALHEEDSGRGIKKLRAPVLLQLCRETLCDMEEYDLAKLTKAEMVLRLDGWVRL